MTPMRTILFGLLALAAVAGATAPSGSTATAAVGCGPVIGIQDPELRAHFARLARDASPTSARLCALPGDTLRVADTAH